MHAPDRSSYQNGFVLAALIFLVLVGVLLLAGMSYLYGTTDTLQGLQSTGTQAFVAAESGDQFGVFWLETQNATKPPTGGPYTPAPPLDDPACPAQVTVTYLGKAGKYYQYGVQSIATCAASGARATVMRTVEGQKGGGKKKGAGGSQVTYKVIVWSEQ